MSMVPSKFGIRAFERGVSVSFGLLDTVIDTKVLAFLPHKSRPPYHIDCCLSKMRGQAE